MKNILPGKNFSKYRFESAYPKNKASEMISTEIFRDVDASPLSLRIAQER